MFRYINLFYLLLLLIMVSFSQDKSEDNLMKNEKEIGRVTGIGGIFFKSENPEKTKNWYYKNLGLVPNDYGSMFEFRESDSKEKAYLQWSPFNSSTEYFKPSEKDFMINYRVKNIEALVEQLKENGVTVVDTIAAYEYGKFVHIMDPDGNKIELWEPVDSPFTDEYDGKTTK